MCIGAAIIAIAPEWGGDLWSLARRIKSEHAGPASRVGLTVALQIISDAVANISDVEDALAAERFATIYDASGVSSCQIMKQQEFAMMTKFMFPVFAASEMLGWPHATDLGNNKRRRIPGDLGFAGTSDAPTGFCRIQQIPSWRQGQGAGYRAA
jgi:hypothetical protein